MTYTQFEVQRANDKWATSMKRVNEKILELRRIAFNNGQKELGTKLMELERYIDSKLKERDR